MVADESYRKQSLSKQYFNCRTFTHNKEWKELQNEYVELSDRCASLIRTIFRISFLTIKVYMVIVHSRHSSPCNRWMKFPHWNQTIIVGHRRAVFTWLRVTLKRVKLIRYLFYCYTIGKSSGRPVGNPIKTNLQQQRWSWRDSVSSWTWRGAFLRQPNDFEIISWLWKNIG